MLPLGNATVQSPLFSKTQSPSQQKNEVISKNVFSVESGYSCPLTLPQLELRNRILFETYNMPFHGAQKDVLFPDITISFTIIELYQYIADHVPNAKHSTLFLTGGAACHILSGLEYADIDLSLYLPTAGINFEELILGFFHEKLIKLNPIFENSRTSSYISQNYLTDYLDVSGNFIFFGFGRKIQLKFVNNQVAHRHNIAITDGFHITLITKENANSEAEIKKEGSVYCIDRTQPGDAQHFQKALDALIKRQLVIYEPETVRDLLFRITHKCCQGFSIPNELIQIALKRITQEYPIHKLKEFQNRFLKHQTNHYEDDQFACAIDLFNILQLLKKLTPYVLATCESQLKNPFVNFIREKPEILNTLLEYIHGAYYFAWITNKTGFSGYPVFGQTLSELTHIQPHLCLTHTHNGTARHIFTGKNPLELTISFFHTSAKLKKLGIQDASCMKILEQFNIPFSGSFAVLEKTAQIFLDSISRSPFTIILRNFKITTTQFLDEIRKQNFDFINDAEIETRIEQHHLSRALVIAQGTRQLDQIHLLKSLIGLNQNIGTTDSLIDILQRISVKSVIIPLQITNILYEQLLKIFSEVEKIERNTNLLFSIQSIFNTEQKSTLAYLLIHHFRFQIDWKKPEQTIKLLNILKNILNWKDLSETIRELALLFNNEIFHHLAETIVETTKNSPVKAKQHLQIFLQGHQWKSYGFSVEEACFNIMEALSTQHHSIIEMTEIILQQVPVKNISLNNGLMIIKKLFSNISKLDETRKSLTDFLSVFVPHHLESEILQNALINHCDECLSSQNIDTDEKNHHIKLFVDNILLLKTTPQELHSHLIKFKRTSNRVLFITIIAKISLQNAQNIFYKYCKPSAWNKLKLEEESEIRHGLIVQLAKSNNLQNLNSALVLWKEGKENRQALENQIATFIRVGLLLISSLRPYSENNELVCVGHEIYEMCCKDLSKDKDKLLSGLLDLIKTLSSVDIQLANEIDDLLLKKEWLQEKIIKISEKAQQPQNLLDVISLPKIRSPNDLDNLLPAQQMSKEHWKPILKSRETLEKILKNFLKRETKVTIEHLESLYKTVSKIPSMSVLLYKCAMKILDSNETISDKAFEKILFPLFETSIHLKNPSAETYVKKTIECTQFSDSCYIKIIDCLIKQKAGQTIIRILTEENYLKQITLPGFERYRRILQLAYSSQDSSLLLNIPLLFGYMQKKKLFTTTDDQVAWVKTVNNLPKFNDLAAGLTLKSIANRIWTYDWIPLKDQFTLAQELLLFLATKLQNVSPINTDLSENIKIFLDSLRIQGIFEILDTASIEVRKELISKTLDSHLASFFDFVWDYIHRNPVDLNQNFAQHQALFLGKLKNTTQHLLNLKHDGSSIPTQNFEKYWKLTSKEFGLKDEISLKENFAGSFGYYVMQCSLLHHQQLLIDVQYIKNDLQIFFAHFWPKFKQIYFDNFTDINDQLLCDLLLISGTILNHSSANDLAALNCMIIILNSKFAKPNQFAYVTKLLESLANENIHLDKVPWLIITLNLKNMDHRCQFLELQYTEFLLKNQLINLLNCVRVAKKHLPQNLFIKFQQLVAKQMCVYLNTQGIIPVGIVTEIRSARLLIESAEQIEMYFELFIILIPDIFENQEDRDLWHRLLKVSSDKLENLKNLNKIKPEDALSIRENQITQLSKHLKKTFIKADLLVQLINGPNMGMYIPNNLVLDGARCQYDIKFCELCVRDALILCLNNGILSIEINGGKACIKILSGLSKYNVNLLFMAARPLLDTEITEKIYNIDVLFSVLRAYKGSVSNANQENFELLLAKCPQRVYMKD